MVLKISNLLLIFLILFNFSCAHKFEKLSDTSGEIYNIIVQVIELKLPQEDNSYENITIHSQIDRKLEKAIFNGIGMLNTHVFNLKVVGDRYFLTDYINKTKTSGLLKLFNMFPLSKETVFKRLDIGQKQPIVLKMNNGQKVILDIIKQGKSI